MILDFKNRKWIKFKTNIKSSTIKSVYGRKVPLIPERELLGWKRMLWRPHNLEDIRQLGGVGRN
jgi:hypothetical protein